MTEFPTSWLFVQFNLVNGNVLPALDPAHAAICAADSMFCRTELKGLRRGAFVNPPYFNQIVHDKINVFLGDKVDIVDYNPDGDKPRQAVLFQKSLIGDPPRVIHPGMSSIVFHEESKKCLAYHYSDGDNLLKTDVAKFSDYFFEIAGNTDYFPIRQMHGCLQQKQQLRHRSLQQMTHYLSHTPCGRDLIAQAKDYNQQARLGTPSWN